MGTGRTEEFRKVEVRIALTSNLARRQIADDPGVGLSTLNKWGTAHRNTDVVSTEDRALAQAKRAAYRVRFGCGAVIRRAVHERQVRAGRDTQTRRSMFMRRAGAASNRTNATERSLALAGSPWQSRSEHRP